MQFIIDKLLADAGVSAIVANKVYPQVAPQTTLLPYVTCQVVSDVPVRCREGIATEEVLIQVNAIAATYTQCHDLFLAVRNALDGAKEGNQESEWLNAQDLTRQEGSAHGKAIDFKLIIG